MKASIKNNKNPINLSLYINKPFSSQFKIKLTLDNQKFEKKITYSVSKTTSKSI